MTPTQRTLKYLRDTGYHAEVVERWNPHARIRQDLFGFGDIIALNRGDCRPVIVQCTSGANMASRIAKIKSLDVARLVQSYFAILVIGWRKVGPRGKRKTWQPRIVQLSIAPGNPDNEWEELES